MVQPNSNLLQVIRQVWDNFNTNSKYLSLFFPKHFTWINSFHPPNNPMNWYYYYLIYRWGNRSKEVISLSKWETQDFNPSSLGAEPTCTTILWVFSSTLDLAHSSPSSGFVNTSPVLSLALSPPLLSRLSVS